ncbi:MAG: hypothetical protein J6X44_01845, partial [Thermoguttaceae bacterium]|nr:hypothetical protein [Thermoguttaceae bacterium]
RTAPACAVPAVAAEAPACADRRRRKNERVALTRPLFDQSKPQEVAVVAISCGFSLEKELKRGKIATTQRNCQA